MQFGFLYGSFQGRINRKPFWWGMVLLFFVVMIIAGGAFAAVIPSLTTPLDPTDPHFRGFVLAMQGLSLLSLYPSTAMTVKRLHDLGKSAYFVAFLYVPMVVKAATDLASITGDPENIGPLDLALGGVIFLISIWFLVMLGFFRGTAGPNRYGPDPLGDTARARAAGG